LLNIGENSKEGESVMSDKERKILKVMAGIILVCLPICAFFSLYRYPHSTAWQIALDTLMCGSFYLTYRRTRNLPQPDTLTRLFPKSAEPPLETPDK
jgi:hypothetical protein